MTDTALGLKATVASECNSKGFTKALGGKKDKPKAIYISLPTASEVLSRDANLSALSLGN